MNSPNANKLSLGPARAKSALRSSTDIECDDAFFKACERCGVKPAELIPLPLKDFVRPSDKPGNKDVLEIRREGWEKVRTYKLKLVLAEQEKVRVMLSEGVVPALVAVDEPWVVTGPGSGTAKARTQHSAQEAIAAMAAKQREMEETLKQRETAALQAAMQRQAQDIQRMIAFEKDVAKQAQEAAEKEARVEEARLEREKEKKKEKAEKIKKAEAAAIKAKMAEEEDQKRLLESIKKEKEEDEAKRRLLAKAEVERQKQLRKASEAAAEAVAARRRKTEAVYAQIDARADENVAKLAAREREVILRQAKEKKRFEARNKAKQKASEERIARVLAGQEAIQAEKRRSYDARQAANEARRLEREEEEAQERKDAAKKLEDKIKGRERAMEAMRAQQQKRRDDIVSHGESKKAHFDALKVARETSHAKLCARHENKLTAITDNVERYMRIHEVRRRQLEAAVDEKTDRVNRMKHSKMVLLKKRNIAAHEAARRKEFIKDKLGEMKSRQNFKDLGKLTASMALEDTGFGEDDMDETGGGATANGTATGTANAEKVEVKSPK